MKIAEHTGLCAAIFWTIMLILVIFLWPQPTETLEEPQKTQIKTEVFESTQIIIEPLVEPELISKPPRYGFTEEEIYLMSTLLTGSKYVGGDGEFDFDYGRDEEYDQIYLVLCVVMNRVQSEQYPDTVSEVIWQRGQFSPMTRWTKGLPQVSDISLQRVTDWCKAYDAYDTSVQSVPENHLYFSGDGRRNYSR